MSVGDKNHASAVYFMQQNRFTLFCTDMLHDSIEKTTTEKTVSK